MIARPCTRHENATTCELIAKTRSNATDHWLAEVVDGRHKKPWPGEKAERALPYVCGRHVAPGGVR